VQIMAVSNLCLSLLLVPLALQASPSVPDPAASQRDVTPAGASAPSTQPADAMSRDEQAKARLREAIRDRVADRQAERADRADRADRPDRPDGTPRNDRGFGLGPMGDGRPIPLPQRILDSINVDEPGPDEWNEVAAFFRENSPYRYGLYEKADKLAREAGRGQWGMTRIRTRMAIRYRTLRALEAQQGDLFEFTLAQTKLEDKAIQLSHELADKEDPAKREEFKKVARQFVDNVLAERARRIEKLKAALAAEERNLSTDRSEIDVKAERQAQRFEEEAGEIDRNGVRRRLQRPPGQ
jgi:hypothetical protein